MGLEFKYESARYPNPPPTISEATSSTPIRMAIDSPFRNASGSSAIYLNGLAPAASVAAKSWLSGV